MAVAVAGSDALIAAGVVGGTAHRIGFGREPGVDEGGQHFPHQIRGRLGEVLMKKPGRVDTRQRQRS